MIKEYVVKKWGNHVYKGTIVRQNSKRADIHNDIQL
jgi:hypothetical protein